MGGWVGGCACAVRVCGGGCERGCCREKLPGPTRVRLSVRACARLRARVCTRFDPWCWWRHRHGDGHVMIMRWSCRCVHFAAIMFTATAMPHSRRLCAAAGPAHSRVVHSVSGTKHGRTFREIDGRTSLTPALTSCQALWLFWDGSPAVSSNAATHGLGRKGYGAGTDPTERECQP